MRFLLPLILLTTSALALDLPATKPQKGTIHRWISLPSSFAPWQQVELKARVAGYIEKITVDKGDVVTAQQQLIQIEVPELKADLIGHRAEVAAAEIEVKRLHEARAKSPDLILPQSVDDAEAKLAIAKAGMERTNALIDLAQIKAPFAGTITDRRVDPGAFAAAGGDTLLQLTDISTLRLQVPVIEIETALLKAGQQVEAKVDALGGAVVKGTITRISGTLDAATRTMLIEADFKNDDGKLRPGMFATARIAVEQHDNATIIPVAGLVKEKANSFVFKHVNGQAIKTAIKPGFNDGVNVEVPELKADEVILLPGTTVLTDKQAVSIKP
ncbi:MAG: efflux RND transporter periplasmic adaptor subunit [Verrucomicrobiaceae bacterium]|nr:efflux RND transporter periplasmic adaptor subunit [Verrucomicrobiaceae bacterium]